MNTANLTPTVNWPWMAVATLALGLVISIFFMRAASRGGPAGGRRLLTAGVIALVISLVGGYILDAGTAMPGAQSAYLGDDRGEPGFGQRSNNSSSGFTGGVQGDDGVVDGGDVQVAIDRFNGFVARFVNSDQPAELQAQIKANAQKLYSAAENSLNKAKDLSDEERLELESALIQAKANYIAATTGTASTSNSLEQPAAQPAGTVQDAAGANTNNQPAAAQAAPAASGSCSRTDFMTKVAGQLPSGTTQMWIDIAGAIGQVTYNQAVRLTVPDGYAVQHQLGNSQIVGTAGPRAVTETKYQFSVYCLQ